MYHTCGRNTGRVSGISQMECDACEAEAKAFKGSQSDFESLVTDFEETWADVHGPGVAELYHQSLVLLLQKVWLMGMARPSNNGEKPSG